MGHINGTTMGSMETGYKMRRQRSQRRDEDDEYEGTRDEYDDKQRNTEGQTTHIEDNDNEIDEIDGDLRLDTNGTKEIRRRSGKCDGNEIKKGDECRRTTKSSKKGDDTNSECTIISNEVIMNP